MSGRQIIILVNIMLAALCVYVIGFGIYISQTTGLLKVSSSDTNALMSVSQAGHNAKVIGTGNSKVHLKPGTYQIAAVDNSRQQFVSIQISRGHTSNVTLDNLSSSLLPSTETIKFDGLSSLIDSGLTAAQISNLKQAFFRYKPLAQSVIVNSSSVQSAPHDPNKSVGFELDFIVSIDSTPYKASVSFVGSDDIHLILKTWPSGTLVFDSGVISSQ